MTQAQFNTKVATMQLRFVEMTNIVVTSRQTKDPYANALQDRYRLLSNVLYTLDGYDLSSNLLTDEQILTTLELGILAGQAYMA
jgi:hypothetical protein